MPPKVKTVYIYCAQKVEQGSDLIIFKKNLDEIHTIHVDLLEIIINKSKSHFF